MANAVVRDLFQLMRRPVAEIEWPRGTKLEWIAGSRNVVEVQLGAAINQTLHRLGIEVPQFERVALDGFKELRIADQCHLHRFDIAGAFVPRWERRKHLEIVDHRKRHGERANKILFAES